MGVSLYFNVESTFSLLLHALSHIWYHPKGGKTLPRSTGFKKKWYPQLIKHNMPASYHWEPPASTLAHCLAVIHPKNQDVLAEGCLAGRRQSHLQTSSTSPTPGQRCADSTTRLPKWQIPTFSPWVKRDFALFSPATLNPCPVQELIRSIQTCPVSRSERPPLQHASQLPLGTPSEHFSALSRCHTSQKSGCVGRRVSSLQKTKPSANFQHEPHTRPTVCGLNNKIAGSNSRRSVRG